MNCLRFLVFQGALAAGGWEEKPRREGSREAERGTGRGRVWVAPIQLPPTFLWLPIPSQAGTHLRQGLGAVSWGVGAGELHGPSKGGRCSSRQPQLWPEAWALLFHWHLAHTWSWEEEKPLKFSWPGLEGLLKVKPTSFEGEWGSFWDGGEIGGPPPSAPPSFSNRVPLESAAKLASVQHQLGSGLSFLRPRR